MVATDKRLMTADELLLMPDNDMRHELVRGELVTMAPASGEHGRIASRITRRINLFDPEAQFGETFVAETGFKLESDPDTVRAPGIAFISSTRVQEATTKGYPAMAPDLAVEVLSPSDSASATNEKVREYLAAGSKLVWVVDPRRQTVTVWTTTGASKPLQEDDELDGGEVLPGFRCRVGDLFS